MLGTGMDQRQAPFADALWNYRTSDALPFSTPDHKRGRGAAADLRHALSDALALDIPHAGGVDSTHISLGLLRQAERLAAAAMDADDARYLVNGSTTGNLAMLLATCRDGDEVIISRMLHKSLLTGLIATGARPVYLTPAFDATRNLPLDISADAIEAALTMHPDALAVVLVSPSYVGVTSDLAAIASVCHAASVPLLVDEAWGPHFHFHPALPESAMQAGADAAVSSTHKLLGALTQGSTLVLRDGVLDLERLHAAVDMVQTTSPSALIFASLDATRRQMAMEGERLLARTLAHADQVRDALKGIEGLDVIGPEIINTRPQARFDLTRVIVDVHALGMTGYDAEQFLREKHGVYVEMSDLLSVMLLVTPGDDEHSITRAKAAFVALARTRGSVQLAANSRSSGALLFDNEQVLTPREAYMSRTRMVETRVATGRISADSITPYPPGIPLVAPGERLTTEAIDYLRDGIARGMYVSGLSDPTLSMLRVIA
jgi:arginine/lysine/ornithine decarboxylase